MLAKTKEKDAIDWPLDQINFHGMIAEKWTCIWGAIKKIMPTVKQFAILFDRRVPGFNYPLPFMCAPARRRVGFYNFDTVVSVGFMQLFRISFIMQLQ